MLQNFIRDVSEPLAYPSLKSCKLIGAPEIPEALVVIVEMDPVHMPQPGQQQI